MPVTSNPTWLVVGDPGVQSVRSVAGKRGDVIIDLPDILGFSALFADVNEYVLSGSGTALDPYVLDVAAINALPSFTALAFRHFKVYAASSTISFVAGKERIWLKGNGARIVYTGTTTAHALLSFGTYNADGTPVASDTNANDTCWVENLILDGGVHGVEVGLRVMSAHYCTFHRIDVRNCTKQAVYNRGGVHTTYTYVNSGYDPVDDWTPNFMPENAFILDEAPSISFGSPYPESTVTLRHCESYGHSKDGCRLLRCFNVNIESCAFEAVVQGPEFTGDTADWDAKELYCRSNNGAGIYVGPNAFSTYIKCSDTEYSAEAPGGGGYKMGIVVDSGSRATTVDSSASFNAMVIIAKDAVQVEVRGGDNSPIIANGSGVIVSGGRHNSIVVKGPSLKNYYYRLSVYGESFQFDEAPPQTIGGFMVGYDPYNNPGPVRGISFTCLYHKDLAGGGYPNYALSQEPNGLTRLNGSEVWISVSDNGTKHMDFQLVGGVLKIGAFGATPVAQQSVGNAATDLATVITLANNLRTALNNFGWTKV
jgi:hypothetical protein